MRDFLADVVDLRDVSGTADAMVWLFDTQCMSVVCELLCMVPDV
jgi:hypothetical protein